METLYNLTSFANFIVEQFPIIALIVLALTALIVVFRTRYQYNMKLHSSKEEKAIRALAAKGTIDADEAEKLLKNCNALPEANQLYPEPDCALKLVSAVSMADAALKLLMIAAVATLHVVINIILTEHPEFGDSISLGYNSSSVKAVIFLTLLAVLAAGKLFAARRLCRGGTAARNYLIFIWIFEFIFPFYFGKQFLLFKFITAAGLLYTLYVLVFRTDAVKKLSVKKPEFSRSTKISLSVLTVLSIAVGLLLGKTVALHFDFNSHCVMSSYTFGQAGPVRAKIEKIILIQGTPDPETLHFSEILAEMIYRETAIPTQIQKFADPATVYDFTRELPLIVVGTEPIHSPFKRQNHLSAGLSGKILSADKNAVFNILPKNIAFSVYSLRDDFFTQPADGLKIPSIGISFNGKVLCGYNNDATSVAVTKSAEKSGEALVSLLQKSQKGLVAKIPQPESKPAINPFSLPDLSGLNDLTLIYRCSSYDCKSFDVYRFKVSSVENDLAYIRKQLGKDMREGRWIKDIIRFSGKRQNDKIGVKQLHIILEKGSNSLDTKTIPRYGFLVCYETEILPDKKLFLPETLDEFRRKDPVSFALLGGIQILKSEADRSRLLEELSGIAAFDAEHKILLLPEAADWNKCKPNTQNIYQRWFRECVDQTVSQPDATDITKRIDTLFKKSSGEGQKTLRQYLTQKLGSSYQKISIPERPGRIIMEFSFEELKASKVLECIFSDPDYTPLQINIGISKDPKSGAEIISQAIGGRSGSSHIDNTVPYQLFCQQMRVFPPKKPYVFFGFGSYTYSSSSVPFDLNKLKRSSNYPLEICYALDTNKRCLTLGIFHDINDSGISGDRGK